MRLVNSHGVVGHDAGHEPRKVSSFGSSRQAQKHQNNIKKTF